MRGGSDGRVKLENWSAPARRGDSEVERGTWNPVREGVQSLGAVLVLVYRGEITDEEKLYCTEHERERPGQSVDPQLTPKWSTNAPEAGRLLFKAVVVALALDEVVALLDRVSLRLLREDVPRTAVPARRAKGVSLPRTRVSTPWDQWEVPCRLTACGLRQRTRTTR